MDAKTTLAQLAIVLAETALERDQLHAENARLRARVVALEASHGDQPEVASNP